MPSSSPDKHAEQEAVTLQQARKVVKTDFYRPARCLIEDITFSVSPGSVHGFVGHNGAGKSTSLKLLIGAIRPTSGHASVFGRSPLDAATRQRIGYLPEFPRLPATLTPRELLSTHAVLAKVSPQQRASRCDELLSRIEMEPYANERTGTFSKGMQQRVAIALAMVSDPELAILDEPMSGLDPAGRRMVRELIRERRQRGKTVLFSSHVLPDVEELCDTITIVHHGRTVATEPLRNLITKERAATIGFITTDEEPLAYARDIGPLTRDGDQWLLTISQGTEKALGVATSLRDKGAEIIAVTRASSTLESELSRRLGESADDPRALP